MYDGYQPSIIQQFDGIGNLKEHIVHSIETYNDVGMYDDFLIKQFISLKEQAFDQYTNLKQGLIYSQDHLDYEFLDYFYSTTRLVSMIELTKAY